MNAHHFRGFADEIIKMAKKKDRGVPWALARGLTSAAAGAVYPLPALLGLGKKALTPKGVLRAAAIGAGLGLTLGTGKGFMEKKLEKSIDRAMRERKK